MSDKTPLREAREAAGLSRSDMATRLGTTVHRYWQSDMGTPQADPELTARAWELLGLPPQEVTSRADEEPPREPLGPRLWYCPRCSHEEWQPFFVTAVIHVCPKRKGMNEQRERLVIKTAQAEQPT